MRIMGLDIGKKRIGIALSDELMITAQPFEVLKSTSFNKDCSHIIALAEEKSVTEIVLGLPLHMSGEEGDMAERVKRYQGIFHDEIKERKLNIKTTLWDERLSTSAVTKTLIEGGARRSERKEVVDKLAAAYILQGFLDYRSRQ